MTSVCSRSLLACVLSLAVIPAMRAGDLKIVTVDRSQNGNTFINTRYYKGERTRLEWRDQAVWKPGLVAYGPPRASIWQCDAQRAIDLNLKSRQYAVTELNEECRSKAAPPLPAPKGTIDIYVERTDTGERRQILGRTARHIITHQRQVAGPNGCWRDAKLELDGWYIDIPEQEVDRKLRHGSIDESAALMTHSENCRDQIKVRRTGVEKPGFPLKLVQTWRSSTVEPDGTSRQYTSRWETAVTEFSQAPLDPALFELPAGFTQVAKIDGCPDVPFSAAVGYWWHRTLNAVRSWL